jgi:hypothetical protein
MTYGSKRFSTIVLSAGGSLVMLLSGCAQPADRSGPTPASGGNHMSTEASTVYATLHPAARRYVDAVNHDDLDGIVAAFQPDATIVDVGRKITGADAIRTWARNEVIGGRLTLLDNTPRRDGTRMLVTFAPSKVSGFHAYYDFSFRDDRISAADLRYA